MLFHVKSEQVSLAKRATRSGFVFAGTLLGALLIHRLWLFDAVVAAGAFLVFDSQRREYEIEVTDEMISMRGVCHWATARFDAVASTSCANSAGTALPRFFFGYVWIPATMPQYEEIKNKAMSWLEIC